MTHARRVNTVQPEAAAEPRVVVTRDPENSELPLEGMRSWITPVEQFYVRNHFRVPPIDPAHWRLRVGADDAASSLTLDQLESLPFRTVIAALECAGNGRSFHLPPVKGVPWGPGAVSNGEWSGPALAEVLSAAGIRLEAAHIHLTGADRGAVDGAGEIPYRRSLPRDKALDHDTIVALRLNGELLTAAHGAPARVLVPGWYGMASVKWLVEVAPAERAAGDHFMTREYTRRGADGTEPLDWVQPKAEIARPREGAQLFAGRCVVAGAAWGGIAPIARVEMTVDGGARWVEATLEGPRTRYGWRLWSWHWDAKPGTHRLAARATDDDGRTQPDRPDPSAPGYMNHWVRYRLVEVR